ncbi:MAG: hypothetical protein ACREP7_16390 [Lysobacter sp.]
MVIRWEWVAGALALSAIGWWFSPLSPRPLYYPAPLAGSVVNCPMPPTVVDGAEPLQTPVPAGLQPFRLEPGTLTALAGFSIEGRVLSRRDYRTDRFSDFAPTDLGLGWGRMREDSVLAQIHFRQEVRFLTYRWPGRPPIPLPEIQRSSANVHIVPANAAVARELKRTHEGSNVRVDGWLVHVQSRHGWETDSSLTREDTGPGACEIVYACSIRVR